jgi:hypothetical protein
VRSVCSGGDGQRRFGQIRLIVGLVGPDS